MVQEQLTQEEKARRARNEMARKWRKAHRDKIREAQVRYYAKLYDKMHSEAGDNGDR